MTEALRGEAMRRGHPIVAIAVLALGLGLAEAPGSVASSAAPAAGVVGENGYGPLHVGMTWAQARGAMPSLRRDANQESETCFIAQSRGLPGVYLLFEGGHLGRVTVEHSSRIATARGIRVGSTLAQVRAAYGPRLVQEAHAYEGPPAVYLTYWTVPHRRGIRFETDTHRRVSIIHGGNATIEYVEGCS